MCVRKAKTRRAFCDIGNCFAPYKAKAYGVRIPAEWNYGANATRRRRRIPLARFFIVLSDIRAVREACRLLLDMMQDGRFYRR